MSSRSGNPMSGGEAQEEGVSNKRGKEVYDKADSAKSKGEETVIKIKKNTGSSRTEGQHVLFLLR